MFLITRLILLFSCVLIAQESLGQAYCSDVFLYPEPRIVTPTGVNWDGWSRTEEAIRREITDGASPTWQPTRNYPGIYEFLFNSGFVWWMVLPSPDPIQVAVSQHPQTLRIVRGSVNLRVNGQLIEASKSDHPGDVIIYIPENARLEIENKTDDPLIMEIVLRNGQP